MTGYLLDHWRYTWADVWRVLARTRKAPADLFVRLYRTAYDFLEVRPERGSAKAGVLCLPLWLFGVGRLADAGSPPRMGGMSRLRRLVISDRWFFATRRVLPWRHIRQ